MADFGGLVEQCVAKAKDCFALAKDRPFAEGSALLLTYATAMHDLADRGRLQAGDVLLILGAAGGVGISAIEIGRLMGAAVVAAVSSKEKAAAALRAGAHKVLIYPRAPLDKAQSRALASAFKEAVGRVAPRSSTIPWAAIMSNRRYAASGGAGVTLSSVFRPAFTGCHLIFPC